MQPDHTLYEEMVRRGSRGRWFWLIGSWIHSAGLLGVSIVLVVWPVMIFLRFGKTGISYAVALLVMAGLTVLGSFLKKISYRIALGDGIDIARYF